MMSSKQKSFLKNCYHNSKMGANGRGMSLFGGFLFSEKRFWRFWDRFHFVSGFLVSMCFKAAVDDMSMRVGFALWMASGRLC